MNNSVHFNGSPTVDGYYTTFDSSEVNREDESSGGGSGDFSIATLTLINTSTEEGNAYEYTGVALDPLGGPDGLYSGTSIVVPAGSPVDVAVPLYKGSCVQKVSTMLAGINTIPAVSGNIVTSGANAIITGDCTISAEGYAGGGTV